MIIKTLLVLDPVRLFADYQGKDFRPCLTVLDVDVVEPRNLPPHNNRCVDQRRRLLYMSCWISMTLPTWAEDDGF